MHKLKKGLDRFKELFWFSDSEPNEALIALCHIIALPGALCVDFANPNPFFIAGSIGAGLFQLWAVLLNGTLRFRLLAVEIAGAIAIMTVINLYLEDLLNGSRLGWVIICMFALWNIVRVIKEKITR